MVVFLLVVIGAAVAVGMLMHISRKSVEVYRGRQCMGKLWRREFPDSPKEDIRQFLWMFASSFAIPRRQALLLRPDDELLAIYRARYPVGGWPDALEFETLANDLDRIHDLSLRSIWHDRLSMGELFAALGEQGRKGLS
ncbi:hypothetical protein [Dyella silvae]|uniref:hypothetical protein n=1 Tax=Dyella silvae TaxID=2994424 RepID=UPI00226466CD|nr:hypothetical protein [Dyella silvae]